MKTIGIVLVIIGIVALIYSGFNFTTKEKVVDVGPIEINKEKKHAINWPPITGVVLLLGGALLIIVDKRRQ